MNSQTPHIIKISELTRCLLSSTPGQGQGTEINRFYTKNGGMGKLPLALEKRSESPPGSQFCCCVIAKSCLTLCHLMDCSLPGSSVHGIFQARILDWLPFPSPGDLPNSGVQSMSSALQGDSLLLSHQGSPNKCNGSVLGDISLPTCQTALRKVCTKVPSHSGDSPSPPLCCAHLSEP